MQDSVINKPPDYKFCYMPRGNTVVAQWRFSSEQSITWNAFQKATSLKDTVAGNAYQLDIIYGPDQQRWKTVLKKNNLVAKTTIFAGDYEKITKSDTTTHLYYIQGGIYVKQTKGATTTLKNEMYYVHPDHLGSLTIITDANGAIKQKCTFDAWGNRTFVTKDNTLIFDRGYTGHEHLPEFGLINMNGRMYDPLLGRFLSPDPYVQMPDFSQDFNRYSYVRNNPLIYTDPSGEIAWLIPAIKIGVMMYMAATQTNFMYAAQNGGNPFNPGDWNWKNPMTYISMASAGFGAFADVGGLNAFKDPLKNDPFAFKGSGYFDGLMGVGEPEYYGGTFTEVLVTADRINKVGNAVNTGNTYLNWLRNVNSFFDFSGSGGWQPGGTVWWTRGQTYSPTRYTADYYDFNNIDDFLPVLGNAGAGSRVPKSPLNPADALGKATDALSLNKSKPYVPQIETRTSFWINGPNTVSTSFHENTSYFYNPYDTILKTTSKSRDGINWFDTRDSIYKPRKIIQW